MCTMKFWMNITINIKNKDCTCGHCNCAAINYSAVLNHNYKNKCNCVSKLQSKTCLGFTSDVKMK